MVFAAPLLTALCAAADPNTQAIIYVVDSSDTERIGISREEFHNILSEDELSDALILVYANKQVGSEDPKHQQISGFLSF